MQNLSLLGEEIEKLLASQNRDRFVGTAAARQSSLIEYGKLIHSNEASLLCSVVTKKKEEKQYIFLNQNRALRARSTC